MPSLVTATGKGLADHKNMEKSKMNKKDQKRAEKTDEKNYGVRWSRRISVKGLYEVFAHRGPLFLAKFMSRSRARNKVPIQSNSKVLHVHLTKSQTAWQFR